MPILRSSSRIARRADQQGARPSEGNQSGVEKFATGSNICIQKCNDSRCKTCPMLSVEIEIHSNVSNKFYACINAETSILSCRSQNLVYLLTCNVCNIQYVGETCNRLNMRMNSHRTSTHGCSHVIAHKQSCVGCSFSINIIEKLSGSGYGDDNKPEPEVTRLRQIREDFWIKQLRTLYPYGLNEKACDKLCDPSAVDHAVGRFFPPLRRCGPRPVRTRRNEHKHEIGNVKQFFEFVHKSIIENIKGSFNIIRVMLNRLSKNLLKKIGAELLEPEHFVFEENYDQWYSYITDIIETKFFSKSDQPTPKSKKSRNNVCVVNFVNKGMEQLNLSKIFRSDSVVSSLPEILRKEDNIPAITFKLDFPIRNKILNYKISVSSLVFENVDGKPCIQDLPECNCTESTFCDPAHQHIVTGDLRIIENSKLRKLISKGPNYREPKTLNYNKCITFLESALNSSIVALLDKYKLPNGSLDVWKNTILNLARDRSNILKSKKTPQRARPTLKDPVVIEYLADLHSRFVLVPIDKASNNVAIICKRFYILKILNEIGLLDSPSSTYELCKTNPSEIIDTNIKLCKDFDLPVTEKHLSLPFMYWLPKMHKIPSSSRFIVASAVCATKPLTKIVSIMFSKIFKQIQSFNSKCLFYKNYNRFWVIQNSKKLIDRLKQINSKHRARSISTFDFSTLYTKLPHKDLIKVLKELIDFVFNGGKKTVDGNRKYLTVQGKMCYFSRKKHGKTSFTKNQVKMLVEHLISEAFFMVGNVLCRQNIGIPMGIDPAPFWANLYLYHYENDFMMKLIKSNDRVERYKGFKFKHCFRFIDDCCNVNDSGAFNDSYKQIYPPELELKCEHAGLHATFLELDITVEEGVFVFKLFDKRDEFPFRIVRMPDLGGNIPSHIFYGSISSEFLRIARATLRYSDFLPKAKELHLRMLNQGASVPHILKLIDRLVDKHSDEFNKFGIHPKNMKADIRGGTT